MNFLTKITVSIVLAFWSSRLVYAEPAPTIEEAIAREKAMKKWNRAWKIKLIECANPNWDDLWDHII